MARPRHGGTRQRILDAAEQVVVEQGARSLTLDAVAARATVSKGGLLYHFDTEDALLRAMVDRLCATFEVRTREHMSADGGPPAALVAYVSVALERDAHRSVAASLIAALANDTSLLEPMREHLRRWVPQLDPAAPSFADRAIVWLATEGLWLLELLELSPLDKRQRAEIAARLHEVARGEGSVRKRAVSGRRNKPVKTPRPRGHVGR